MKGVFVTATGTDIGKTFVSCLLAKSLSENLRVGVMKPFSSGSQLDAVRLIQSSGRKDLSLKDVNPIYYKKPLAPYSAAGLGRKKIDFSRVFESFESLQKKSDFMIVEGIGGLAVPLTQDWTAAHLAHKLGLPIVIVTHLGLGTLNHTFLTVDYARKMSLTILGLISSDSSRKKDLSYQTNFDALPRLTHLPWLLNLPYGSGSFDQKIQKMLRIHSVQKQIKKIGCLINES